MLLVLVHLALACLPYYLVGVILFYNQALSRISYFMPLDHIAVSTKWIFFSFSNENTIEETNKLLQVGVREHEEIILVSLTITWVSVYSCFSHGIS